VCILIDVEMKIVVELSRHGEHAYQDEGSNYPFEIDLSLPFTVGDLRCGISMQNQLNSNQVVVYRDGQVADSDVNIEEVGAWVMSIHSWPHAWPPKLKSTKFGPR
jgi:hypothetical protein